MQRIISVQTSRNNNRTSSEFVSKRLWCSSIFSMAFLALLGGFLLGRYATDRALQLKRASLQLKQQNEDNNSMAILRNISHSVHTINNLTSTIQYTKPPNFDYKDFYYKIYCLNHTLFISNYSGSLNDDNFLLRTSKILNLHLLNLNECFYSLNKFLSHTLHVPTVSDATIMNNITNSLLNASIVPD